MLRTTLVCGRDRLDTLTGMANGIGAVSEYATTVVRLFPDYAGSVIWFPGPVSYDETQLDSQLIADLQTWKPPTTPA